MAKIHKTENQLIVHDEPHFLRILIGLPFFLAGGYFFYHLLSSLYTYINDANAGEWLAALPGMFFMLVLGSVLLLPGLFLAARESVVVNRSLGVIGKRRELWGLHTRGQVVNLVDGEQIICRQTTKKRTQRTVGSTSERSTSVTSYLIELGQPNGKQILLLEYSGKSVAKTIAKTLAEFADLPLNDRL